MLDADVTFVTPYWAGAEMMRAHLSSIRRFHPASPILISKRGGDAPHMNALRAEYGVQYWLEECNYVDALLRLLDRCVTTFVCVMDHDTLLLSDIGFLVDGVVRGAWQLVGIEERIRESPELDWRRVAPQLHGWLRLRPGYMDATFLVFDLRDFKARWGLAGVRARRDSAEWLREYHYGICERLPAHRYLRPFHVTRYGAGNLVRDGDRNVLWHQWYGSYRHRFTGREAEATLGDTAAVVERAQAGERSLLADYPDLDFSDPVPAWGPDEDVEYARAAIARDTRSIRRWKRARAWRAQGLAALATRGRDKARRWWFLRNRGPS